MTKTINTTQAYKQLWIGVSLLVISTFLYLYFLNVSVVHVVMRKEADQSYNQLQAEIALLETDYIAAQHTIAERIVALEGYQRQAPKIFVSRTNTLVRAN